MTPKKKSSKKPVKKPAARSKAKSQGMGFVASFLTEFDAEMAATRRVIERVPSEKADWKPHPKSFSMAHLAQLLAWMPGWLTNQVKEAALDLASAGGYSNKPTADLLSMFDKNVREARAAIAASKESDYSAMWSLKRGPMVLMTQPRLAVVRQTVSHLSHHRGQMTVYLRLNDIPVPSIYGPSADERNF